MKDALPPEASATGCSAGSISYFALVGNPNCGKTTLFNALTGLKQKVGNYPGVTVEKKEGECFLNHGEKIRILDLPGSYSLHARSPDESVLRDVLLGRRKDTPRPQGVVIVLDATNLERHLYLATQIMELQLPCILVLNMMDMVRDRQTSVDTTLLAEAFGGIPVIPMSASRREGLVELKHAMAQHAPKIPTSGVSLEDNLQESLEKSWEKLRKTKILQGEKNLLEPLYLLSDRDPLHGGLSDHQYNAIQAERQSLNASHPGWEDQLVASRYDLIHQIVQRSVQRHEEEGVSLSDRLDQYLLHPIWGWAVLLGILGLLFTLIFKVADGPMGWIETFFEWAALQVASNMSEGDLRALMTDGVIAGVGGVVVFLPQILILFFFIGFMEDTGYMARVAFMMDRLMSRVGLNGKSFLPLLSSHACAVPGVMATRTIDDPKDRLITILVSPLAGCSARLPVYLLMIATLVPTEDIPWMTQVGFLLGMYALGIGGAFFFAWLFNRSLLKGEGAPMILELPAYKWPAWTAILWHMWERTRLFLRRAGTVILTISILLWAAVTYPKSGDADPAIAMEKSLAGKIGHWMEPAIEPMGFDWKIGIGLVASFAAREVFVSTMSIIYSVEDSEDIKPLRNRLRSEKRPDGTPVYTPRVCLSLMVFYVFAMQCLSTVAVVKRETNGWKWPLFQFAYMTLTAAVASLLVYQVGGWLGFA